MSEYAAFSWRGEPIHDIEQWAKLRGEQIVRVRETRRELYPDGFRDVVSFYDMPESFWKGHPLLRGNTTYEDVGRRSAR